MSLTIPYSAEQLQHMERQLMAFRYAYYVQCDPLITDRAYDLLEQEARRWLPESSPIQKVGSDLSSDYSADVVELSKTMRLGESPVWYWVDTNQ